MKFINCRHYEIYTNFKIGNNLFLILKFNKLSICSIRNFKHQKSYSQVKSNKKKIKFILIQQIFVFPTMKAVFDMIQGSHLYVYIFSMSHLFFVNIFQILNVFLFCHEVSSWSQVCAQMQILKTDLITFVFLFPPKINFYQSFTSTTYIHVCSYS